MKTIVSVLWYLDPHHPQFKDCSCEMTGAFAKFQDYNDWKRKKEKKPQISFVELIHMFSLSLSSYLNRGVINLFLSILI